MDAASELELRMTDFANHVTNFHPSMIESVASIYIGDHGTGRFWFGTKLVVMTSEDNESKKWSVAYPLADVKYKEDTGTVCKQTVHST